MNPIKIFFQTLLSRSKNQIKMEVDSIYNIKINRLNGKPINLSDFKGTYMLFVNVASKCGFTPQYKDLQELQDAHRNNLTIIGVPCNQFGNQEPGSSKDIESFCKVNYGVTFPITEKVDVKGSKQHPLYRWLTQDVNNGKENSAVKWNFQKYLIDPKGNYVNYYLSTTNPTSIKITKHLK